MYGGRYYHSPLLQKQEVVAQIAPRIEHRCSCARGHWNYSSDYHGNSWVWSTVAACASPPWTAHPGIAHNRANSGIFDFQVKG